MSHKPGRPSCALGVGVDQEESCLRPPTGWTVTMATSEKQNLRIRAKWNGSLP